MKTLYQEEHAKRHAELHKALDELALDYMAHHQHKLFSTTTIMELMLWSDEQTRNANGGGLERDN